MRIYIKTFGCTANKADSLRMRQLLTARGHTFTDTEDSAEMVLVNTCTVTCTTQRHVLKYISSVSGSGKQVTVAGCLSAAQPETLKDINCRIIIPSSLEDIINITGDEGNETDITPDSGNAIPLIEGVTGIVSISQGCVGHCSYCIVRQARGELISRSIPEIVQEVRSMIASGAKELQLSSQDISAYGLDTGVRLPELLKALTAIDGDHMIRVGMMNPFTILDIVDEVADAFKETHIFKFLHLPIQSGSERVLESMNRKHTVDEFKLIVQAFREMFPSIILSTDFIVGYPTETNEDFNATLKLLENIKPQKVNITRYSPRPNTPASLLYDMPDRFKKERSRVLTNSHHDLTRAILQSKVGEQTRILTTHAGKNNSTVGRDSCYNMVAVRENLPLGEWHNVTIVDSTITYLIGEVQKEEQTNK
ncbi:MAG: tRNA (N(6)-L-threonylcarbamoyladenosine(37)-C(2))-methylthiotransferase [Methanosarcinales archaeon]|nr:tRNA (N(6)-L-threonylcarbamoyladenosine(37)-C(2))-methylthiotransferase [ANME-2 cluster archaeon]MDW7776546.1 tRNA (N(6)-L-threonylcarbamoyladenosine(37)-C(2))-methylthiotransferase [Methanosarcinales archaeon]